jgi:hypothetical protein
MARTMFTVVRALRKELKKKTYYTPFTRLLGRFSSSSLHRRHCPSVLLTLVSIQNKENKNYGSNNDLLSFEPVSSTVLRTVGCLRMGAAMAVGDD